jgi:DNA polymerase-1
MPKIKRLRLMTKRNPSAYTLIMDAKYLIYRSQYSPNAGNLSHEGTPTGLYYFFFNTVRQLVSKFNPINMVFMWDSNSEKSIRKKEFSGYKNRNNFKYMKPEQIAILERIKKEYPKIMDVCKKMGFAGYYLEGYEADDLIAMYVKQIKRTTDIIITRDEDMYQCIDDYTFIYNPDDKIKKTQSWFRRTYDLEPYQWGLVKAYGGCKSDTVPGIPGVGEKKAIDIINGCATEAIMKKVDEHKKEVNLYKRLTVLPHPNLKDHNMLYKKTKINIEEMSSFFQRMNMRSLLEKLVDFESLIE